MVILISVYGPEGLITSLCQSEDELRETMARILEEDGRLKIDRFPGGRFPESRQ